MLSRKFQESELVALFLNGNSNIQEDVTGKGIDRELNKAEHIMGRETNGIGIDWMVIEDMGKDKEHWGKKDENREG